MKLPNDPRLPTLGGRDYERSLYQRLYTLFRDISQTTNGHDDDVTQLQDDVTQLQDDVTQLQDDVTQLQDDVTQLQDDVTQLQDDVTQLQDDVTQLQGEIAAILADMQWMGLPVGVPFPIWTHLAGIAVPPTDSSDFRFIKLTAADPYNDGVLTSESVSGSAPLITATAVVDYAGSPIDGQTVALINTERVILRPGDSGVLQAGQIESHVHISSVPETRGWRGNLGLTIYGGPPSTVGGFPTSAFGGDETRMRNRGADFFMRIA